MCSKVKNPAFDKFALFLLPLGLIKVTRMERIVYHPSCTVDFLRFNSIFIKDLSHSSMLQSSISYATKQAIVAFRGFIGRLPVTLTTVAKIDQYFIYHTKIIAPGIPHHYQFYTPLLPP